MSKFEVATTQNDIIILVLGPSGAGKSTFIEYAAEEKQASAISDDLRPCTQDIRLVKTKRSINEQPIVLVDTPGFDDISTTEILILVSSRLQKTYGRNLKLGGILYLHRISDNRMAGPPLRNFELLASACGKTAIPNVTLITTMWKHVSTEVGTRREEELKSTFWNEMTERGCPVERFGDTGDSALDIVALSLKTDRDQLCISHETEKQSKGHKLTGTGVTLNNRLEKLLNDQKEGEKRLSALANNSERNQREIEALKKRMAEIKKKIAQTAEEMRDLKVKISLPRRLWQYFLKMFPGYQKPESSAAFTS